MTWGDSDPKSIAFACIAAFLCGGDADERGGGERVMRRPGEIEAFLRGEGDFLDDIWGR